MMRGSYSVAFAAEVDAEAQRHLLRRDGQEDLCFAIWHPSVGSKRTSALVARLILPHDRDRRVHGNASFLPTYFERAVSEAISEGGGLAFLHSHPGGRGWQGMSDDDINAELGNATAVKSATALPLVGLTLAGDRTWSARFWVKTQPRTYKRNYCTHVRVVGERLALSFNDTLVPKPRFRESLSRTVSAWGAAVQADIARLHVGVIGAGSVGSIVAEAIARTGIRHITLVDFDTLRTVNLDRTLHATEHDATAHRSKVECLARGLRQGATAENFVAHLVDFSIGEEIGYRALPLIATCSLAASTDRGVEACSTSWRMRI